MLAEPIEADLPKGPFSAAAARLALLRARLNHAYGARFVWYLVVVYLGMKGAAASCLSASMLPLFKHMGVSGTDFQLGSMIASTPWSTKGWLGVLSDGFPLGAYHKRGYLLLFSVLGIIGSGCLLGVMDLSLGASAKWLVALLYMLPNLQFATFDLLCEGKYTELMRDERAGPEVLSLVWICICGGGLAGSCFVAATVDSYGARPLVAVAMLPGVYAAWLTVRGSMPEAPLPPKRRGPQWAKLRSEPKLFLLAFCMAAGALAVSVAGALAAPGPQVAISVSVTVGLCVLSFYTLPGTLARGNLYMFFIHAFYLDLSGPLAYYYTASPECILDAPHFSYSYYLAVTSVVGAFAGTFGSALFQFIQGWSFRRAFMLTTCVQVMASIFDIAIVKRWNIALGISDAAAYLFGDAACQNVVQMLGMMPALLLTSKLCPRGAEATVFAVLAGFQNFGNNIASILGVGLTRYLDVRTSANAELGETCDVSYLTTAIIIAHMALPLMCVPLACCLVPNLRMDDEDAFSEVSPPPSFRSPPSPASSEAGSGASTPRDIRSTRYQELPGGEDDDITADFVMTDSTARPGALPL